MSSLVYFETGAHKIEHNAKESYEIWQFSLLLRHTQRSRTKSTKIGASKSLCCPDLEETKMLKVMKNEI